MDLPAPIISKRTAVEAKAGEVTHPHRTRNFSVLSSICNISGAKNGVVALEELGKHDLPNLILLDMIMPVMDGWQFAIEFVEKYDHLCPIIVMSAAADAEKRAKDIDAKGWIEKPFNMNKLLGIIERNIGPKLIVAPHKGPETEPKGYK